MSRKALGALGLSIVGLVCPALLASSPARAADANTEKTAGNTEPPKPIAALSTRLSLSFGTTSWRTDTLGYGGISLGLRLYDVVTPFVDVRLGYGSVDQRLLTMLAIGVEGGFAATSTIYPRARFGFVHQHEESMAAVAEEPFGAVLGIGKGIRHRAGVVFGLGCDFVFFRRPKISLSAGPELSGAWLTYSSGPPLYVFVGANLGLQIPLF